MKTENLFAVSLYENRNGASSWRVAGWLHGVRIRKNYKTKEEAAAAKAVLELNALQTTSRLRPIATALNEDQVREAEAAFHRIAPRRQSSLCAQAVSLSLTALLANCGRCPNISIMRSQTIGRLPPNSRLQTRSRHTSQ